MLSLWQLMVPSDSWHPCSRLHIYWAPSSLWIPVSSRWDSCYSPSLNSCCTKYSSSLCCTPLSWWRINYRTRFSWSKTGLAAACRSWTARNRCWRQWSPRSTRGSVPCYHTPGGSARAPLASSRGRWGIRSTEAFLWWNCSGLSCRVSRRVMLGSMHWLAWLPDPAPQTYSQWAYTSQLPPLSSP